MTAYLNLFSPATHQAFTQSTQTISGFRTRHQNAAQKIKSGSHLLCYLTKLSRWIGILEVIDGPFTDDTPIFQPNDDPFIIRFHVTPRVWLPLEQGIPIKAPEVWSQLSFTKDHEPNSSRWTGKLRTSLATLDSDDAALLTQLLEQQKQNPKDYPLTDKDRKQLIPLLAKRAEGSVSVTVPEDDIEETTSLPTTDLSESFQVQAKLAKLGADMGMRVWLPINDRSRVLQAWDDTNDALLHNLPLNYDTTTLKTIENIDVIWMKKRAIIRAFEVEHTTAIYSGILRMADLLALQPNMDINLHIVAPGERRDKVFEQLKRPVFSLLERQPLAEVCSFLSYEKLDELATLPHLTHLSHTVIDDYAETDDESL